MLQENQQDTSQFPTSTIGKQSAQRRMSRGQKNVCISRGEEAEEEIFFGVETEQNILESPSSLEVCLTLPAAVD